MSKAEHNFHFSRRCRISRQEGFSGLLQERPLLSRWFAVHSRPNNSGCARLGLSVGKRHIPSAAQRNRLKRKIRENFRLQVRSGLQQDVIIRLRRPIEKTEQSQVFSVLTEILKGVLAKK
ncbi:MAG: ribonuclease P protein component [Gammaproteobacteria bacterium]|nr:ribonuclease P protein component [Gammaproteobacteria bacterium]MBU1624587.1 ribonuclease P protein component [Gammaproteobacteria bacterium]MBU1982431.1 ribonuclease P protein component [Gammaproteobacteria bacterium]